MNTNEWVTTKEAAAYTNRSIDSIRRWLNEEPKIRKVWESTHPKGWRLSKEDLDTKMNSLQKESN